jgi:hypothetical protein
MALESSTSISDDLKLLSQDVPNEPAEEKEPEIIDEEQPIIEDEPESDDEPEVESEPADKIKKEYLPHERPPISAVKKEFPELFKRFPQLEHMYFREKEYTEVFPTVADAKEAAEASEALTSFRDDLFTGDGAKFTSALKEAGELDKFSRNFLTNLQKTDKDAYWNTITPTLQNLVTGFFREGQRRNDANLIASAENLSIYLFDTAEVAQGKRSVITETPKEDKRVTDRLADIERNQYNTFRIGALEGIATGVSSIIDLSKSGLSTKMQTILSDQISKEVDALISKDAAHMKYVNGLWNKAKGSYTNDIKSKIISAYLERAKSLVPSIRRRLLSEALGTSPEESRRKLDKVRETQLRREPGSQGKPSGSSVRVHNAKSVDWNKTSDVDFLSGNVTLKNRSK